jgi:DGQHR domain-containing protein
MKKTIKPKKVKPPLSAQDILKRDHFSRVRTLFRLAGFKRISKMMDKEFTFEGSTCDIDDVFYLENVIVFVEYTVSNEVSTHLKKKSVPFRKMTENPTGFLTYLKANFPAFVEAVSGIYDLDQCRIFVLYASRHAVANETKSEVPSVTYLDYNVVRYLESVSRAVRHTARYEILEFLGLPVSEFGSAILNPASAATSVYDGSVLPESHSNYGPGFKVASFYIDPGALLQRAYVLRRDGWRGGASLYQRMISSAKIEKVRRYLRSRKRVFINNVIATLPSTTKIVDEDGVTTDTAAIKKTKRARIQIPDEIGTIGIIDGQHRLFAYHEGGSGETEIAILRKRQNLLVTGIIFPPGMSPDEQMRFQANLFLEINSTQTAVKSDLTQEIEVLLRPYSPIAIAKRVINRLNEGGGALGNHFERYFYDQDKMKTTSVVSYALAHLVRIGGPDSLFTAWTSPLKQDLKTQNNDALLEEYVAYCSMEVAKFMSAVKSQVPAERWTADRKVPGYFLTTTTINGCLSLFRRIVRNGKVADTTSYKKALEGLEAFKFSDYKSSQYNKLGEALYNKYFS